MDFLRLYGNELDLLLNDDDRSVLYTTERRKQAVNDGQAEFADLTECYIGQSTITVVHGQPEYVLSTIGDFSRVYQQGLPEYWLSDSNGFLTILAGDDFVRRDELILNRREPGWRASTVTVKYPRGYWLNGRDGQWLFGLVDKPQVGSSEVVALVVPYVAHPVAMSGDTDIPYTDTNSNTRNDLTAYHIAAAHYAAYKLLPLSGRVQEAGANLQIFQSYVDRYKGAQRVRGGQQVQFATDYFRRARRTSITYDASIANDATWRWK